MIDVLLDTLPVCTEEGGFSTSKKRKDLIDTLISEGISEEVSVVSITFLEEIFNLFSILDTEMLKQGSWRFVSYPASIFARSVLSSYLENGKIIDPAFWYSDATDSIIEEQRNLLQTLELRRLSTTECASPIRYVHVAWAIIRIGDCLLLNHREDRSRIDLGNYVFVGGRVNLDDLDVDTNNERIEILSRAFSQEISDALPNTLRREMVEETWLREKQHYSSNFLFSLPPYHEVEGARSNHAYTEYDIHLFSIELTQSGFFKLSSNYQDSDGLSYFSLQELVNGKSKNGKTVYIDALIDFFRVQGQDIYNELDKFPVSWKPKYLSQFSGKSGLVVPFQSSAWYIGTAGHEKHFGVNLDNNEQDLLFALSCYGLGYQFKPLTPFDNQRSFLSYGWVEIDEEQLMLLKSAVQKLTREGVDVVEIVDHYARISTHSDQIFIDPSFFTITLDESRVENSFLVLRSKQLESGIGEIQEKNISIEVKDTVVDKLRRIDSETVYKDEMASLDKYLRRGESSMEKVFQKFGLRKVLRTSNNRVRLAVKFINL